MSNDSLLSCAILFFSCADCIGKTDNTDYRELSEREERVKSFVLCVEYKLSDERMIRNVDGFPLCVLCKETIENTKITLVLCNKCNKFMGHPICFKKQKICPSCIKE